MCHIIIAILIYLGVIFSPNTYHLSQLKAHENQYAVAIADVQGDEADMLVVHQEYIQQAEGIIIIDDTQW